MLFHHANYHRMTATFIDGADFSLGGDDEMQLQMMMDEHVKLHEAVASTFLVFLQIGV